MKQTSVEWLVEKLTYSTSDGTIISHHKIINKLVEQAKAMEKEQLMKAFKVGFSNGFASDILSTEKLQKEKERLFYEWFEQYYKETFKPE